MTDILLQAESYITGLFREKLPWNLLYHNLEHTRDVVQGVREIGKAENLSESDMEIVELAAWFHDAGYTVKYVGHEEESAEIATEVLRYWGYPEERIEVIEQCIMSTKFRHEAKNVLESVLIDSDRLMMGKPEFERRGEDLRAEWGTYLEKTYTDGEWADVQVKYLNETRFYTHYAQLHYDAVRLANIKRMKELGLQKQQSGNPITKQSMLWREQFRARSGMFFLFLLLGQIISQTLSITLWGGYDYSFWIGVFSGMFISLILYWGDAAYEKYILRKFDFPTGLVLGSFLLVGLFKISQIISLLIYEIAIENRGWESIKATPEFKIFTLTDNFFTQLWIAFIISLILSFVKLMSRIIGPRVMLKYLTGQYHKPREEERIFMFVDLNSSTTLAEKMEINQYHSLLNHFFYDISPAIGKYKGEIYQYVGDEVVITWKMEDGIKNSNCIRCYFRIKKQIAKMREEYIREFGFVPDFKAGLHGGTVVTGQVGKNKIEIVFHGDVINTTERIMNQCNILGEKVLISENLLRRIDLLPNLHCEYVGTELFRGKENEVALYKLTIDN